MHDRVAALPWILALAGLTFGAIVWVRVPAAPEGARSAATPDSREVNTLKATLASANAMNDTLRKELDRMRATSAKGPGGAFGLPGGGGMAGTGGAGNAPSADQQEIGNRLKDALSRAQTDPTAAAQVATTLFELLRTGPGSVDLLRDAYVNTTDPRSKKLLLMSMAFSGSQETRDFVADQLQTEKDPQVRQVLVGQAAQAATGDLAKTLAPTFIQTIDSTDDLQTRIAAVRGLRYAPGADAPGALMRAAADPSDEMRIAAIDVLASRPGDSQMVQQLLANDPSPRVREFAQCRMLVAKETRSP